MTPRSKAPQLSASAEPSPWATFSSFCKGQSWLADDALYSIPPRLIDLLQHHAPRLLRNDDAERERLFSSLTHGGFVHRQSFSYPPHMLGGDFDDHELQRDLENAQKVLDDIHLADGHSPDTIACQAGASLRDQVLARWSEAFAGWLIADKDFRRNCNAMRSEWDTQTKRHGFAHNCFSFLGESPHQVSERAKKPAPRAYRAAFDEFREAWGLQTLLTWELPLPMAANFDSPFVYSPLASLASD
jgi:hypothetical protein